MIEKRPSCHEAGAARRRGGLLGWVHHDDAAAATVAALEHGRAGQAYNIVDDQPATWEDVFTTMAAALGAPPPPGAAVGVPARGAVRGHVRRRHLDALADNQGRPGARMAPRLPHLP